MQILQRLASLSFLGSVLFLSTAHAAPVYQIVSNLSSFNPAPQNGITVLPSRFYVGTTVQPYQPYPPYATGAIFAIDLSAGFPAPSSDLHTFAGQPSDGSAPSTSLTLLSDGNLYGGTLGGGASQYGTLYRMTQSGVVTILRSIAQPATEGQQPTDQLVQAANGKLYGIMAVGGPYGPFPQAGLNGGTLFSIATNGTSFQVLHRFGSPSNDGHWPSGLTLGSDGNLYGVCSRGGNSDAGTVFKYNIATSTYSTIYRFSPSGIRSPRGLMQASNGRLYGAAQLGGGSNLGGIYRITTAGTGLTNLHSFVASEGNTSQCTMAQMANGDKYLFGTNTAGGLYNHGTLYRIKPDGSSFSVIHHFGSGTDGQFPIGRLRMDGNAVVGTTEFGGAGGKGTVYSWFDALP